MILLGGSGSSGLYQINDYTLGTKFGLHFTNIFRKEIVHQYYNYTALAHYFQKKKVVVD
jgi:hypothetical protein